MIYMTNNYYHIKPEESLKCKTTTYNDYTSFLRVRNPPYPIFYVHIADMYPIRLIKMYCFFIENTFIIIYSRQMILFRRSIDEINFILLFAVFSFVIYNYTLCKSDT